MSLAGCTRRYREPQPPIARVFRFGLLVRKAPTRSGFTSALIGAIMGYARCFLSDVCRAVTRMGLRIAGSSPSAAANEIARREVRD